ncbi:MAG: Hsp20/alpha crystallin family protein [Polyangiaceae bacterium]
MKDHTTSRKQPDSVMPAVDVYENAKEILLVADVPGVEREGLDVRVDGDRLVVEGRRSNPELGTALFAEYRPLNFSRTFAVPPGIDPGRIDAELSAGVLRLHLPKRVAPEPRKIPIRVS